jgi:hypothetical protein
VCDELTTLRARFEEAITTFDAANESLYDRIGVCPRVEFRALSRELDRAWINLSRARRALHEHIVTHNCQAVSA